MLNSDAEGEEGLSERGRELTMKLRELQLKKQHMENLVRYRFCSTCAYS